MCLTLNDAISVKFESTLYGTFTSKTCAFYLNHSGTEHFPCLSVFFIIFLKTKEKYEKNYFR